MTKIPLRKESIIYLLFLGLITIFLYIFLPILTAIPLILLLFVLYFYGYSVESISINKKSIISPADSIIMSITDVNKGNVVRGSIIAIGVIK